MANCCGLDSTPTLDVNLKALNLILCHDLMFHFFAMPVVTDTGLESSQRLTELLCTREQNSRKNSKKHVLLSNTYCLLTGLLLLLFKTCLDIIMHARTPWHAPPHMTHSSPCKPGHRA